MPDQEVVAAQQEKKPRHRSPAYPTIGLKEAVQRVAKLYEEDGKAGAPPEIAAVHIGFSKPHGQAMSALAALKKFGLLSESNGRLCPSQRSIEIINLPASDPRKKKALRDAVVSPDIYRELIEAHKQSGWPKNDVLESELITYRNFNPNSVKGFVSDLMDSLEFAGLSDLAALELTEEDAMHQQTAKPEQEAPTFVPVLPTPVHGGQPPLTAVQPPESGQRNQALLTQTLVVSIPRNFKVDIGVRGDEIKKEDLAKIKSQFNRWIEGLEEAFE
jgi:hypothetical protein